ncbi:MAG TPA: glutaminase [Bacteroidia bacterium]|nr:glutaminase [Bacteroidia bacterium]
MDYKQLLERLSEEVKQIPSKGEVAGYIPELKKVNADKLGAYLIDMETGKGYGVGDCNERFSLQSISKVFSLTLAFSLEGDQLWKRVGIEPSGNAFNSLIQLEYEKGIPRNPFINAGAIVIADILINNLKENTKETFLNFVRKIAAEPSIGYNQKMIASEKSAGFRNAALINFMRSFGNIKNDIDEVIDFYYHICSIEMNCEELSRTFLLFANHGKLIETNEEIISMSKAKRINAIMQTCGFYDEAGEFSFRVGLPGKSGIGGGIVATHPGKYSIAVWSPKLNPKGNSFYGVELLERLTTNLGASIF